MPVGTTIQVRTNEWLSTDRNLPGDGFNATLAQPIVINGWVVAQRGQSVLGRVTMVQKNHGTTQLGLQMSELTFVDGQLLPIQTQLSQTSAGTDSGRNVGVVGATTTTGAVIGAIAAGGRRSRRGRDWSHCRARSDHDAWAAYGDSSRDASYISVTGAGYDLHGEKQVCVSHRNAAGLQREEGLSTAAAAVLW